MSDDAKMEIREKYQESPESPVGRRLREREREREIEREENTPPVQHNRDGRFLNCILTMYPIVPMFIRG